MSDQQRALHYVPNNVKLLLIISFSLQLSWQLYLSEPQLKIRDLITPPKVEILRILSFGDSISSAKLFMLWLQNFGAQAGRILPYKKFDYNKLQQWLEIILALDPDTQYPLLAASHLYANVSDAQKKRHMLEFVYQQFFVDPQHRWMWLANAAVQARHRLKDLPLALKYAKAISDNATPNMPRWAQEMQIFILEEMGEFERALLVIGGMLDSGYISEQNQIRFLSDRLETLSQKAVQQRNH